MQIFYIFRQNQKFTDDKNVKFFFKLIKFIDLIRILTVNSYY